MSSSLNNPFANLMNLNSPPPSKQNEVKTTENATNINEVLEKIFQITLDQSNDKKRHVFIEYSESDKLLNQENIDEV